MNYYPFHPGDYLRDTAHLSPMEDIAYRRLLDMYYLSEMPIPHETDSVSRRLRLDSALVASVLKEFFTEAPEGWTHRRCDKEIAVYQAKAERAKNNGKAGGRPKKTQPVISGFQEETESEANHNHNQNQSFPKTASATPPPEGLVLKPQSYSEKRPKASKAEKPADPRHAEFVRIFADEYEAQTGSPYAMQGGKDGQQLQALLRSLPGLTAAEWLNGLRWAWETAASHPYADSCVRQTGSLAAFCAAWSRIVSYHATYKAPTRR